MKPIRFLTLRSVLRIHDRMVQHYGGEPGVRDHTLLDSALSMPMAGMGGEYFHTDIFEMAAAYCYHIVMNHPFFDGNKRTGMDAAEVFLKLNGYSLVFDTDDEMYDLVIAVTGGLEKAELATAFRNHAVTRHKK